MEKRFVVSYDLGTSGVKAALVSLEGKLLGTATADYPLFVEQEGWAEQEPELYWDGVCTATKEVIAKCGADPAQAAGLAFSTQWKGIIPIGAGGKVLRRGIIWLDSRAGDQARRLNEHFGKDYFQACDYWPKLLWLRENCPEVYERAEMILEVNSFLKWKATGTASMDITNCFVRSYDPELQAIYNEVLEYGNIDIEKFPSWTNSYDMVGHVTAKAAEEMGLVPGIPVFGGCGDIPAMAIGSGNAAPGGAHIYFGSSGWMGYTVPHQKIDFSACPLDLGRDVGFTGDMNAVGLVFNWAVKRLYQSESASMGGEVFSLVNREVAEIPAGSEGLLCTPWFYGELAPITEHARGTFWNLGTQHDRRHMVRAVMEGICYTFRQKDDQRRVENGYVQPKEFTAIGGGSLSPVWMQMLADILNVPVNVPRDTRHTGAVGTACCVLMGLGLCRDFDEVREKIVFEHRYEPKPENVAVYAEGFRKFMQCYDAVVAYWNKK